MSEFGLSLFPALTRGRGNTKLPPRVRISIPAYVTPNHQQHVASVGAPIRHAMKFRSTKSAKGMPASVHAASAQMGHVQLSQSGVPKYFVIRQAVPNNTHSVQFTRNCISGACYHPAMQSLVEKRHRLLSPPRPYNISTNCSL